MRFRRPAPRCVATIACAVLCWAICADSSAETLGVRHRIEVVVSAELDSPVLNHLRGSKGSLSFKVRLSANSNESRYFGMLSPSFSDIVVPENVRTPLVE